MPIDLHHGNWFGLVFVDLGTHPASHVDRLAAMKRTMDRIKGTKEAIAALAILMTLGRVPKLVDRAAAAIFGRKASVVVTNVPGPRTPLVIAGSPLRDLFFWVPHPAGLACGASVISYAGNVRVGIRTDESVLAEPARLARYFAAELAVWPTTN
jgi:diacylglycerol O-acyltransferase